MKRAARLLLFFLTLAFLLPGAQAEVLPLIRVGLGFEVNLYKRNDIPSLFLQTTFETLERQAKGRYRLQFRTYTPEELTEAIQRQEVDVFFATSFFYRERLLKGARDLASAANVQASDPNRATGALVLVRAIGKVPRTLLELKGWRIGSAREYEGEALQSLYGEIARYESEEPERFFRSVSWFWPRTDHLINALQREEVDAVVLPACNFEAYSRLTGAETSWLAAVSPRSDRGLACAHSTELYPGLTAVSLPGLPPAAARLLTQALLGVPVVDRMQWSIATDFSGVDRMLFRLNRDAWVSWRHWSFERMLRTYWPWAAAVGGLILGLSLLVLLVGFLVRRRTAELRNALLEQERLHREAETARERMEKLQKTATIGQMAGVFAHELSQPLTAISGYAHGIRNFAKDAPQSKRIIEGLDVIDLQTRKIIGIVERVRGYVKAKASRSTALDLREVLAAAIESFRKTSDGGVPVRFSPGGAVPVRGDALELELVFINVFRNASQAQRSVRHPWIAVECGADAGEAWVQVTDNGPPIAEEVFAFIRNLGESTKPEGLGLGLPIAKSLLEAHGGELSLSLSGKRTMTVRMTLPLADGGEGR